MKKHLLSIFVVLCLFGSSSSIGQTTIFSENFSGGILPSGWTNDSLGLPAVDLWFFGNPYARVINGAGFDADFAIFDSDQGSTDNHVPENASLTTPDINVTTIAGVPFLELDEQYRFLSGPNTGGSSRKIEYSTNGGSSWTTIVFDSVDYGYPNPALHSSYQLNLTGAATVRFRFNWIGTYDWWWAIDNVELKDFSNCTAPPNAGTAESSLISVCSFEVFDLSLIGADNAIGITYQWQVSTDNINWGDIVGAIASTYSQTGQTVASYYRCNLTCSGQTSSSVAVAVAQNSNVSCPCIPTYTFGCDALNKVAINTLLNDGTGCNGNPDNYILYPDTGSLTTNLGTGDFYNLTIASGAGSGAHGAAAWFDFNADGDFQDLGEFFHISDTIPPFSLDISTFIIIPSTALLGPTRMRVRYIFDNPALVTSDCSDYGFGETEDYTVNVVLGTSVANNPLQLISISPVPAHERIHIQSPISGAMNITMFDQTGRICKNVYSATNSVEINTSDLAAGVYFVRFDNEKYTITKKIILN